MTLRFHESLGRLVAEVEAAGIPLDDATVFLRDGEGRLMVARESLPDAQALAASLSKTLGAYASMRPVIDGRIAAALVKDQAASEIPVVLPGRPAEGPRIIRMVDRRFVGADWMVPPEPVPQGGPPRLVFSSLKGGVGRSTALAVLAADLARHGLKALAIDLDLEAPGIGFMLLDASEDPAQDRRPNYGVLDYLVENGLGGVADEELFDFVGVSPFTDGSVDVVPVVGRVTDQHPETMLAKLSRAHVEDAGSRGPISFTNQVREMVDRFAARAEYDVILIDARAGLAESSAPALLALGAEILFFGADQPQTFHSYRYLFAHLLHCFGTGPSGYRDWRGHLSFVQAKAPSSAQQRIDFRDRLHGLCAEFLYDKESLAADGSVQVADFNFGVADAGRGVPHDALFVAFHPDYMAFDSPSDGTPLDPDVYRGPFGDFLNRTWDLLGLSRDGRT
ncbi:MAG: hypothetical protein JZU52_20640 [Lamprocystis purpurea]|uniref:KGGVGR-motif variant AAA ATPase n=1 Tax=Lamprocystis purpurea TaxID=61598 RepID=UPI00039EEF70|nr:hypothetical protein [Lamprocystis purpurea]MBV5275940.1 hypothetical protein [Lamprocystis purpurea]